MSTRLQRMCLVYVAESPLDTKLGGVPPIGATFDHLVRCLSAQDLHVLGRSIGR